MFEGREAWTPLTVRHQTVPHLAPSVFGRTDRSS
jgi:hypothetical protein